jgi:hypothetical protein
MSALSNLVSRKIAVMFPDPTLRRQVERSIASYAVADEGMLDRVRLAILKLSEGVAEKINLAGAIEDPEDTIAWAERPEWMASVIQNRKLSEEEQARVDTRDWIQYHEWLAGGLK